MPVRNCETMPGSLTGAKKSARPMKSATTAGLVKIFFIETWPLSPLMSRTP